VVRTLGVAILGHGGIARAHVNALRRHAEAFPDAPAAGRLVVLAGRTAGRVAAAAQRFGAPWWTTDWQAVLGDAEVDAVINAGPNDAHAEPSIGALRAGKAVLCEKPLGRTAEETEIMARAAAAAPGAAVTGFNHRFVPAVLLARRLIHRARTAGATTGTPPAAG